MGNAFLHADGDSPDEVTRSDLQRELAKRLRRLKSIISFESLSEDDLFRSTHFAAAETVWALTDGRAGRYEQPPDVIEVMPSADDRVENVDEEGSEPAEPQPTAGPLHEEEIGAFLKSVGFEIRDRLHLGGNLWILGDENISSRVQSLSKMGWEFSYRDGGGQGTGYQSAWLYRKSSR
jgi:hypothetical protein